MPPLIENFSTILNTLNREYDAKISNNFTKDKVVLGDEFLSLYKKITENPELQSNNSDALKVKSILSKYLVDESLADKHAKLKWFKSIRDEMISPSNGLRRKLEADMKKVGASEGVLQTI